jgi:hypothetical protein
VIGLALVLELVVVVENSGGLFTRPLPCPSYPPLMMLARLRMDGFLPVDHWRELRTPISGSADAGFLADANAQHKKRGREGLEVDHAQEHENQNNGKRHTE